MSTLSEVYKATVADVQAKKNAANLAFNEVVEGRRGFWREVELAEKVGVSRKAIRAWAIEAGLEAAPHGKYGYCIARKR